MPFSIDFCHRRSRDTGVQYRLSLKKKKKGKYLLLHQKREEPRKMDLTRSHVERRKHRGVCIHCSQTLLLNERVGCLPAKRLVETRLGS